MQAIDSLMKEDSIPLNSDLSDLMSCLDVKMRVVFHIRNIDDVSVKQLQDVQLANNAAMQVQLVC